MNGRPWHKRYHSDALSGFIGLSLEERGAYQTFLDLLYDRGAPIPDNDRLLAGYMNASVRKWKSLRQSLIEKGKIKIDGDGNLFNLRAMKQLENDAKTSRKRSENGLKGARKKYENEKNGNEINEGAFNLPEQKSGYTRAFQKPEARKNITTSESPVSPRANKTSGRAKPDDRLLEIMSLARMISPPGDGHLIGEWLSLGHGWNWEDHILPVIKRVANKAHERGTYPRKLLYFDDAVREGWEEYIRQRNYHRKVAGKPLLEVVGGTGS